MATSLSFPVPRQQALVLPAFVRTFTRQPSPLCRAPDPPRLTWMVWNPTTGFPPTRADHTTPLHCCRTTSSSPVDGYGRHPPQVCAAFGQPVPVAGATPIQTSAPSVSFWRHFPTGAIRTTTSPPPPTCAPGQNFRACVATFPQNSKTPFPRRHLAPQDGLFFAWWQPHSIHVDAAFSHLAFASPQAGCGPTTRSHPDELASGFAPLKHAWRCQRSGAYSWPQLRYHHCCFQFPGRSPQTHGVWFMVPKTPNIPTL